MYLSRYLLLLHVNQPLCNTCHQHPTKLTVYTSTSRISTPPDRTTATNATFTTCFSWQYRPFHHHRVQTTLFPCAAPTQPTKIHRRTQRPASPQTSHHQTYEQDPGATTSTSYLPYQNQPTPIFNCLSNHDMLHGNHLLPCQHSTPHRSLRLVSPPQPPHYNHLTTDLHSSTRRKKYGLPRSAQHAN